MGSCVVYRARELVGGVGGKVWDLLGAKVGGGRSTGEGMVEGGLVEGLELAPRVGGVE